MVQVMQGGSRIGRMRNAVRIHRASDLEPTAGVAHKFALRRPWIPHQIVIVGVCGGGGGSGGGAEGRVVKLANVETPTPTFADGRCRLGMPVTVPVTTREM